MKRTNGGLLRFSEENIRTTWGSGSWDDVYDAATAFDTVCTKGSRPFGDFTFGVGKNRVPYLTITIKSQKAIIWFSRLSWSRFIKLYGVSTTYLTGLIRQAGAMGNEEQGLNYIVAHMNELMQGKHGAKLDGDMNMLLYRHSGYENHWTLREMGLDAIHRKPLTATEFLGCQADVDRDWLNGHRFSDYFHTIRYRTGDLGVDVSYHIGNKKLYYRNVFWMAGEYALTTDARYDDDFYEPEVVNRIVREHQDTMRSFEVPEVHREYVDVTEMAAQFYRACSNRRVMLNRRTAIIEELHDKEPHLAELMDVVTKHVAMEDRPDQTGRLERVLFDMATPKEADRIEKEVSQLDRGQALKFLAEPVPVEADPEGEHTLEEEKDIGIQENR